MDRSHWSCIRLGRTSSCWCTIGELVSSQSVGAIHEHDSPTARSEVSHADDFLPDGELSRNGTFLRWNLSPTHCAFRSPHLLLFDEAGGRTEVRDINSGKMCEIIVEEKGTKAVRATSMDADMLIIGPKGLKQIVEVGAGSDSQHRASGGG